MSKIIVKESKTSVLNEGQKPLVSVVVLCYNIENYLDKCLKSISLQTFKDFECVIIDDGSTDSSSTIYKQYISKDNRFRVVYGKHKGLTAARKAGFNAAKGTWCVSIDGDDWANTNMLERLTSILSETKADFVQCRELIHYNANAFRERVPNTVPRTGEYRVCKISELQDRDWLEVSLCRCLLKTDKLRQICNKIDNSLLFCEDGAIMAIYASDSYNVCMLGDELYHYRMRKGSATSTPALRTLDMIYGIHDFMVEEMKHTRHRFLLLSRYSAYFFRHCLNTIILSVIPFSSNERSKYIHKAMSDKRFLHLYSESKDYLPLLVPQECFDWIKEKRIPNHVIDYQKSLLKSDYFD